MKQKRFILCFFIIGLFLSIFSCKEEPTIKGQKLSFGQSSCYSLGKNEMYQAVIDSVLMKKYATFYNLENVQMPINRVVTRANDTLFIALAIDNNIDKIEQAHKVVQTHKVLEKNITDSTLAYFLAKDNQYNYRYIFQNKSSKLVFLFNYISSDSSHVSNLYDQKGYVEKSIKFEF